MPERMRRSSGTPLGFDFLITISEFLHCNTCTCDDTYGKTKMVSGAESESQILLDSTLFAIYIGRNIVLEIIDTITRQLK